jgi:arabinose-5-phosphate isomerase
MGKSGHVGRKIAATLASTGTPAFFVHPAEASHGDLGMILPGDAVVALSNSGETAELSDVVAHARRFAIPLIAVTGRAGSALARAADCMLLLPAAPEACPMGLTPTTSTTMAMALGDALAVAVMQARGTTIDDIARFHPAGTIGSRLAPVESLLRPRARLPQVGKDASMADAVVEMSSSGRGAVCVLDDNGDLLGIITDGDVRRSIDRVHTARCIDVMTKNPLTVREGMSHADAYHIMHNHRVNVIVVVARDNALKPLGIVHIHDIELLA